MRKSPERAQEGKLLADAVKKMGQGYHTRFSSPVAIEEMSNELTTSKHEASRQQYASLNINSSEEFNHSSHQMGLTPEQNVTPDQNVTPEPPESPEPINLKQAEADDDSKSILVTQSV